MKAVPNAQPPSTMCHQKGIAKYGCAGEASALNSSDMPVVPSATPAIVRQEPTRVSTRIAAPIRQASAEVSPMLPGSSPTKAFHHDRPIDSKGCVDWRSCASTVAPEKPSTAAPAGTAVHTLSPEISAG